jgi:hypothetical protein
LELHPMAAAQKRLALRAQAFRWRASSPLQSLEPEFELELPQQVEAYKVL